MTWFFGMIVSALSLIGLGYVGFAGVKKLKGVVWIAVFLAVVGFVGYALLNGLLTAQGVGWPIEIVPAVLASIGVAVLVKQLFPSGSGGGHGHGAAGHGSPRRVDWRAQMAGVVAGAAVLVGIWWGYAAGLPGTTTASLPVPAAPSASASPTTTTPPTPAKETISAQQCAKYPPRARRAMGCP